MLFRSDTLRWADLYLGPASVHLGASGNEAIFGYDTSNNYLSFDPDGDGGTPEIVFTDTGNVGIGTTTINARLSIEGGGADILNLFGGTGTEVVTVLNNGNVGIGTTAPSDKLHVIGDVRINGSTSSYLKTVNDTGGWTFGMDSGSSAYQFKYGVSSPATKVTILSSGNVGIGTTSPVYKLDVYGNFRVDGTLKIGAYTLPSTDGTANYILKTDGSGVLTWQADNDTNTTYTGGTNLTLNGTQFDVDNVFILMSTTTLPLITTMANLVDVGTITALAATDLTVTNTIVGSINGNSATVSTITGLAPDTATTQATQGNITSIANLVTVGVLDSGSITGNFGSIDSGTSLSVASSSPAEELTITGQMWIDGTDNATSTIQGNMLFTNNAGNQGCYFEYDGVGTTSIECFFN